MKLSNKVAMIGAAFFSVSSALAAKVDVDLSTWSAEGGGRWSLAADNNSVFQGRNGPPTVFFTDTDSQGLALSGTIEVQTTGDDDFIGFVLGYNEDDLTNDDADYVLVDWKQADQNLYGGTGLAGLAISRVQGQLGDNSGAWWHDPQNNVTEVARANNLGRTGWEDNTVYNFDLVFTGTRIQVFVNEVLELDIQGKFKNGGFGFYNYSQTSVRYGAIQEADAVVPVPGAALLFAPALAGGIIARRRARKAS